MRLVYDIEIVSASVMSRDFDRTVRSVTLPEGEICNIVIPWPMEVLRSKIKRGMIISYMHNRCIKYKQLVLSNRFDLRLT